MEIHRQQLANSLSSACLEAYTTPLGLQCTTHQASDTSQYCDVFTGEGCELGYNPTLLTIHCQQLVSNYSAMCQQLVHRVIARLMCTNSHTSIHQSLFSTVIFIHVNAYILVMLLHCWRSHFSSCSSICFVNSPSDCLLDYRPPHAHQSTP